MSLSVNDRDKGLLQHILLAIADIALHQQSSAAHLTKLRATVYELIIIGEAVANVSDAIKEQYSEIPWQKIKDSRNKMVHDYEDVSEIIIMDIVQNHLPLLQSQIETILRHWES